MRKSESTMLKFATIVMVVSAVQSTSLFDEIFGSTRPKWHSFKATWGINLFTSFNSLPRKEALARGEGFTKLSGCNATAMWRGSRYVKDGDRSVTLLFDINGYIAGVQEGVPKGLPNGYPSEAIRPPFVEDGDFYVMTVYFVDPATICSEGRTDSVFDTQGTGNSLYIQNGTNPETDSTAVPLRESDIANTLWTRGKCFYTMGRHYWYNMSLTMSCDQIFPVFLLYNDGWLDAFGWSNVANLNSSRYEKPRRASYSRFIDQVPYCLDTAGTLSTLHFYFTNPLLNWC